MNAKYAAKPPEAAASPATERDAQRRHLRQRLARLIAEREAAKQTANRAIRGT